MPFLAFLLVLALAFAAGCGFRRASVDPRDGRAFAGVTSLLAGLLLLHLVLAWLDLAGVPWHPLVATGAVAAIAVLAHRWARIAAGHRGVGEAPAGAVPEPAAAASAPVPPSGTVPMSAPAATSGRGRGPRLGWAGLAGAGVVAFFAALAATERIAFPDFVYHWGIKGHRYFLERGVDYDFLAAEWNLVAHRDYPQLVPELFALQSLLAGRFSEPALLLWSAVFFAGVLVAAREALAAWQVGRETARLVFVALALALGVFAVGHQMAGSVDWIVALALTAALPALVRVPSAQGELQLGMLAAIAASSKLEGLPLAALLVGAGLWRRLQAAVHARRSDRLTAARARADAAPAAAPARAGAPRPVAAVLGGAALRLVGPLIVAVLPWAIQGLRHHLFRDPQSGAFELERAPAIAAAVWRTMLLPEWHFVPFVLLLAPLLFLRRETRLAGAIVALQMAFYLVRYFTASFDYEFSVLSSFPRLMFHVVPAVALGLAAVAGGRFRSAAPAAGTSRPALRSRAAAPRRRAGPRSSSRDRTG